MVQSSARWKTFCSWMVHPLPYIHHETSSGHRALGFLHSFRVRGAETSETKAYRQGLLRERGRAKSDPPEGLSAPTWDQGETEQLESSDSQRHNQHRTAVTQLTYQEEQKTLHSLSCPELVPGILPEPEQGSGKQTVQVHSSAVSSSLF